MRYATGDVVTDGQRALTGRVLGVCAGRLVLGRPGGFEWEAAAEHCWPASPQEREAITPRGALRIISTSSCGEWRP
ncbi:hypothetical protein [Streptomyces sp. NPDC003327]